MDIVGSRRNGPQRSTRHDDDDLLWVTMKNKTNVEDTCNEWGFVDFSAQLDGLNVMKNFSIDTFLSSSKVHDNPVLFTARLYSIAYRIIKVSRIRTVSVSART